MLRKPRSREPLRPALAVVVLFAVGCSEEPSYRLRWEIEPRDDVAYEPLPATPDERGVQDANECTRVGIVTLEATVWDDFGFFVHQRTYSCFPPNFTDPRGTVKGPTLPPGRYELVTRGVRRNGIGWTGLGADLDRNDDGIDELDPVPRCESDGVCETGFFSCDCRFIDVAEDETIRIDDLVLGPPPECEDGIDNDNDGLVDAIDPGCAVQGRESVNVNTAQFRVQVGLLGDNQNVICSAVGINEFSIGIDGSEVTRTACQTAPFFFTADLEAGPRDVSVVALDRDGNPVTAPEAATIEVPEDGGGVFDLEFDFGDTDFLEPIVARTTIPLLFESRPGGNQRGCVPLFGDLVIDTVRINVLGPRGMPLDTPVRLEDGTPLDGTPMPCPTRELRTQTLRWGGYLLEIEGLSSAGDVCFSTLVDDPDIEDDGPQPAGPGRTFAFPIPRPDQDAIPASCTDCDTASRPCLGGAACIAGVCVE